MGSYSPADFGAVLQGAGALAQAAAIGVAAWFATNTFDVWRKQKLSERRIEQAERILIAAYKVRRALEYVRNPMMWSHEISAAEAHLETKDFWSTVTSDRKQKMITAQGYYNRLNSVMDERRALDECLPMARALFGEPVEKALELLNRQFHLVRVAADMNVEYHDDRELERSIREDLSSSAGSDRPNKMNGVVEDQVKIIEDSCLPFLTLETQ